jgi:H+-transporting ATPase
VASKRLWRFEPGRPLFLAIAGTQITATLITVYGILFTAIGWQLALFVWIYSLIEFVIVDFSKIPIYNLLEHKGLIFHR